MKPYIGIQGHAAGPIRIPYADNGIWLTSEGGCLDIKGGGVNKPIIKAGTPPSTNFDGNSVATINWVISYADNLKNGGNAPQIDLSNFVTKENIQSLTNTVQSHSNIFNISYAEGKAGLLSEFDWVRNKISSVDKDWIDYSRRLDELSGKMVDLQEKLANYNPFDEEIIFVAGDANGNVEVI